MLFRSHETRGYSRPAEKSAADNSLGANDLNCVAGPSNPAQLSPPPNFSGEPDTTQQLPTRRHPDVPLNCPLPLRQIDDLINCHTPKGKGEGKGRSKKRAIASNALRAAIESAIAAKAAEEELAVTPAFVAHARQMERTVIDHKELQRWSQLSLITNSFVLKEGEPEEIDLSGTATDSYALFQATRHLNNWQKLVRITAFVFRGIKAMLASSPTFLKSNLNTLVSQRPEIERSLAETKNADTRRSSRRVKRRPLKFGTAAVMRTATTALVISSISQKGKRDGGEIDIPPNDIVAHEPQHEKRRRLEQHHPPTFSPRVSLASNYETPSTSNDSTHPLARDNSRGSGPPSLDGPFEQHIPGQFQARYAPPATAPASRRSEEHTSELQSP